MEELLQEREALRRSLRSLARKLRDALSQAERSLASACICKRMCQLEEVAKAHIILLYSAFRSEVETEQLCCSLIQMGKKVCAPLINTEEKGMLPIELDNNAIDLRPGYCGIPEPVWRADRICAPEKLDIVVQPGLLFDRAGNRLGYGGGYYDRFLALKAPQALRIGLAFSCQVTTGIPAQKHDMRLDILITEKEILRWPRPGFSQ
ncbi:MAG: 5-formyltetrahydrofolate cyclo-ligase [Desulfobulbaceae bacterium]|nr:5-formyltetrahydrofolate cyclo-ligase [Desulfobulbaceae bacterium]